MIDALIDKTDVFEQVRDAIASIVKLESVSQQALAVAAEKDSTLWKLRVYSERINPWEVWLDDNTDQSPVINVWFDNAQINAAASNTIERQDVEGVYNIDCYGYGESAATVSGHTAGDQAAALTAHRAARLVRNILMSDQYMFLGFSQGAISRRWLQSITAFQPQQDSTNIQKIVAVRLELHVHFNEFSPQNTPENLEYISAGITRADDGEVLAEADFDFTEE